MATQPVFENRQAAGLILATRLTEYAGSSACVLALPRGGVPVGFEIARALRLPLNVIVARKIGSPSNPEYGVGAISELNSIVYNDQSLELLGLTKTDLAQVEQRERRELARRVKKYRGRAQLPDVSQRTIILADDGLATGITVRAALAALAKMGAYDIVLAVPVCATQSVPQLVGHVSKLVCLKQVKRMQAVGLYYYHFDQVSDDEVVELLAQARAVGKV